MDTLLEQQRRLQKKRDPRTFRRRDSQGEVAQKTEPSGNHKLGAPAKNAAYQYMESSSPQIRTFSGWPKETGSALINVGAHLGLSVFSSWEELASLGLDGRKSSKILYHKGRGYT